MHRELDVLTQLEIKSLTTGGWGYLYFPTYSRVVRTYPRPIQGMTARFHKSWADFGGLKTIPQLDYECATILAAGGVVNIGDQLHPRGTLDKGAYSVIGEVYKKVEAAEPYCRDAEPLADIAVLLLPETKEALQGEEDSRGLVKIDASIEGAAAILASLKHQWNGETPDSDNLSNYKVVIIPDRGHLTPEMKARLIVFLNNGGKIFSHEATLEGEEFGLPLSPVQFKSACPYTPSYMRLGDELGAGLPDTEFVNYQNGTYVEASHSGSAASRVPSRSCTRRSARSRPPRAKRARRQRSGRARSCAAGSPALVVERELVAGAVTAADDLAVVHQVRVGRDHVELRAGRSPAPTAQQAGPARSDRLRRGTR